MDKIQRPEEYVHQKTRCTKSLAIRYKLSFEEVSSLMDNEDSFEKIWSKIQSIEDKKFRLNKFFKSAENALKTIFKKPEYRELYKDKIDLGNLPEDPNLGYEEACYKNENYNNDPFLDRIIDMGLMEESKLDQKMIDKLKSLNIPYCRRRLWINPSETLYDFTKIAIPSLLLPTTNKRDCLISHPPSDKVLRWVRINGKI